VIVACSVTLGRWILTVGTIALAAVSAICAVFMLFRYEPLRSGDGYLHLWDRLGRRECITPEPQYSRVTGIACTKQEVEILQAAVYRSKLAGLPAVGDANAAMASANSAASDLMAALPQAQGDNPAWQQHLDTVTKMRADGLSWDRISQFYGDQVAKLKAAGLSQARINHYYGGADPSVITNELKARVQQSLAARPQTAHP
jgi:hypothetical protein